MAAAQETDGLRKPPVAQASIPRAAEATGAPKNTPAESRWQCVFPQENRWKNARTGEEGQHEQPMLFHSKSLCVFFGGRVMPRFRAPYVL